MKRCAVVLWACLSAQFCWADWALDSAASSVQFISVKNAAVTEVHHFTQLQGSLDAAGQAQLQIDLASVETGIPIRNERMQKMLFNTAKFATAEVTAEVDVAGLKLRPGEYRDLPLTLSVSLHGISKSLPVTCRVTGLSDGGLSVINRSPVLISAADFGLQAGVQALQAVAKLNSIAAQVPVNVMLVFRPMTQ